MGRLIVYSTSDYVNVYKDGRISMMNIKRKENKKRNEQKRNFLLKIL